MESASGMDQVSPELVMAALQEARKPCSGHATLSLPLDFSEPPIIFFLIVNVKSWSSYFTGPLRKIKPKCVKAIRTLLNYFTNVHPSAGNRAKVLISLMKHQGARAEFLDHTAAESGLESES